MSEIDEEQLAKARRRLEAALALATSGATDGERAAAWERANSIAQQYRIDLANISVRTHAKRAPVTREVTVAYNIEFYMQLHDLVRDVFRHYGCRTKRSIGADKVMAVGFAEDLAMAEMVFTSAYLAFLDQLHVKWEGHRTFDRNVYMIKNSGRTWMDIVHEHNLRAGSECACCGGTELLTEHSGGRLRAAYKRECERVGVKPPERHSQSPERYRQSYADGFTRTLRQRLAASTAATNRAAEEATPGSAVALRDGEAIVDEFFYQMFPNMRPSTEEDWERQREQWKKEQAAEEARRAALTPEERAKEDAQAEKDRIKREREYAKYRHQNREDPLGWQQGHAAAHKVDLTGGNNGVSEASRKALG